MLSSILLAIAVASGVATETLPATATVPALSISHLPGTGPSVLYVHGATFPSQSSIFYRIDGRSWADDLAARGFDVWGFDLAGYGRSGRPAAMAATTGAPVGRSGEVVPQIERVVRHVLSARDQSKLVLLAHSWGTIPAGAFTAEHPELVQSLILFGPVAQRASTRTPTTVPALQVSTDDQWQSFQSGVPAGEPSPIAKEIFDLWAQDYLSTDPASASNAPPSVRVPSGPQADIDASWSGGFPYDPSRVTVPTWLVRGAWDAVTKDADAAWLRARLSNVPGGAHDIVLPRGAHRMHLETNRQALFDAVGSFLAETVQPTTARNPSR
jgi:pimeloyl-ACP methyl ester carboxylesterase